MNLLMKASTKTLERAIVQRRMDDMQQALENGANVHGLNITLDDYDEPFQHPFEAAMVIMLPLRGFQLLAQYGAKMSNLEGGWPAAESFFDSLPEDIEKSWPDAGRIRHFLETTETLYEPVDPPKTLLEGAASSIGSGAQKGMTMSKDSVQKGVEAGRNLKENLTGGLKSLFRKDK